MKNALRRKQRIHTCYRSHQCNSQPFRLRADSRLNCLSIIVKIKRTVTGLCRSVYSGTSVYVLNPFHILGLIPNRTYTERIFPIRNKGKMINPFPWKKSYCYWLIILWRVRVAPLIIVDSGLLESIYWITLSTCNHKYKIAIAHSQL
jgi:hypothetical protein